MPHVLLLQEITLQYNLCNEPWLKYTMTAVSDRGLKPGQWASARLHFEVLYLESHRQRYELSRVDASASSGSETNSVSPLPGPSRLRGTPCDARYAACSQVFGSVIAMQVSSVAGQDSGKGFMSLGYGAFIE